MGELEKVLLYFSFKYNGNFDDIYRAVVNKEIINEEYLYDKLKDLKCRYTTIVSSDYPEPLKSVNCPPFVLFYYGDLSLIDEKTIGVVGTTNPSTYGEKATQYFVKGLVENNYVIVGGMGLGIDTVSEKETIENNGKTIAVLGSGIDYCYPPQNQQLYDELKNNHLVISEYPEKLKPKEKNFLARNRLIAGFSSSILVTEINLKSSSMYTISSALDGGKDIICVPSAITNINNGCNDLIENGAFMCNSLEDLFKILDNQENAKESEEDIEME